LPLLLDTSVAVELIDDSPRVIQRRHQYGEEVFLSAISRVELEAGVYREGKADASLRRRVDELVERLEELPFTGREVHAYSAIIAARGFSRRLVVDRMIAATAISNDLTLATLNPRDFRDIPALTIEDWSAELI
jgi:tRNA(fMet)-specific endonuclease VapC